MKLECVIERITYQNEENGYNVLKGQVGKYKNLVTFVGYFGEITVGTVVEAEGKWVTNGKYGMQFSVDSWLEKMPATAYGIEKYLGSGLIKGIGPKYASLIVKEFGEATFDVIENEPEKLLNVTNIGKKRQQTIIKSWAEQKEIRNLMVFLNSNGVSTAHATKIYKRYENDSIRVIKENPYTLAKDISGIGFKTADAMAEKLGHSHDSPLRTKSGLIYTLHEITNEGHVFAYEEQILTKGVKLLEVDMSAVKTALIALIDEDELIEEDGCIYLPGLYYSERGVANNIKRIMQSCPEQIPMFSVDSLKLKMEYDEIQKEAIKTAVESKVMILTGGPGTGKTTCTLGIIEALEHFHKKILLASPTGRAAKRLSEVTGKEAKTIHRLLNFSGTGFEFNEENRLKGDVLILDECSMIDIVLMNSLLKAVPDEMKVIMVGDKDQLPSVGPGNVLADLIASEKIPVVKLTRIFRQAQESLIITNAHRVNEGQMPVIDNGRNSDFFFISNDDTESIAEEIVELVSERLPKYYKVSPFDIQVLTFMQRGKIGTVELNKAIQEKINPKPQSLFAGGKRFRVDDKVMQIKNNYDKNVFNGDIGIVRKINMEDREVTVDFDGVLVEYQSGDLTELVHAYAITVHKSQGSEYPMVIMPISTSHYTMLNKQILFTGISRAKKHITTIGTKKAIGMCIKQSVSGRNSNLIEAL